MGRLYRVRVRARTRDLGKEKIVVHALTEGRAIEAEEETDKKVSLALAHFATALPSFLSFSLSPTYLCLSSPARTHS